MTEADAVLGWMRKQPGPVFMRTIGECGPKATRRKADAEPAVAALIAAGYLVEVSKWPRAFRVVAPGAASSHSSSRLLEMLAEAAAECDDIPEGLASYWAASSVKARLVARMRVRNGLCAECEVCAKAGLAVDRAVVEAFDCAMPED